MTLGRYVWTRLLVTAPVLFGVTALTFSFVHLLPGDAVDAIIGFQDVSPAVEASIRAEYHLDQPVWKQYVLWLGDAATLEFGESPITGRDVSATIGRRLPATLALGGAAWLLALAVGIPAGIVAAVRAGEPADELGRIAALAGIATPNFWLGLILLFVFSVRLGWFRVIPPDAPLASLAMAKFMLLPTITLGTASAALITRLLRSSMRRELEAAYVRTARAKGLSERTVILKHVLRNALLPVVTVAGLQLAFLVDGAVVVEQIFSWPGMGRLLVRSILRRDYTVIQATVLVIGVAIVFATLLVDIVYAILDPRIRY
ncbi:peptide ABC transporter permease [Natrinema sp. CBA1119]|uniref:ABC transporter permease n=1 Tax=Natrinema sp. CBA1119 TaxID=1608465 RepID=UPI000BF7A412|nr:ABC transporter permease [Natrinema sp. CBA1119]PGF15209.1 peptide ABC transporter permease [Natrinema sp. CBA1119]